MSIMISISTARHSEIQVGIVARSLEEGSSFQIADASRQFISADNKRALAKHLVGAEIASPKFDLDNHPSASFLEGD